MGNATSGCFVHPAIPVLLRERVVPQADLITPNQFELGFLTETDPGDLDSTLDSVERARAMGPSTVLVTSVLRPDRPEGTIEMLAVHGDGAWIVQTPAPPDEGQRLRRRHRRAVHRPPARDRRMPASPSGAPSRASSTSSRAPTSPGRRELQLVQSQAEIAEPRMQFEVQQIR